MSYNNVDYSKDWLQSKTFRPNESRTEQADTFNKRGFVDLPTTIFKFMRLPSYGQTTHGHVLNVNTISLDDKYKFIRRGPSFATMQKVDTRISFGSLVCDDVLRITDISLAGEAKNETCLLNDLRSFEQNYQRAVLQNSASSETENTDQDEDDDIIHQLNVRTIDLIESGDQFDSVLTPYVTVSNVLCVQKNGQYTRVRRTARHSSIYDVMNMNYLCALPAIMLAEFRSNREQTPLQLLTSLFLSVLNDETVQHSMAARIHSATEAEIFNPHIEHAQPLAYNLYCYMAETHIEFQTRVLSMLMALFLAPQYHIPLLKLRTGEELTTPEYHEMIRILSFHLLCPSSETFNFAHVPFSINVIQLGPRKLGYVVTDFRTHTGLRIDMTEAFSYIYDQKPFCTNGMRVYCSISQYKSLQITACALQYVINSAKGLSHDYLVIERSRDVDNEVGIFSLVPLFQPMTCTPNQMRIENWYHNNTGALVPQTLLLTLTNGGMVFLNDIIRCIHAFINPHIYEARNNNGFSGNCIFISNNYVNYFHKIDYALENVRNRFSQLLAVVNSQLPNDDGFKRGKKSTFSKISKEQLTELAEMKLLIHQYHTERQLLMRLYIIVHIMMFYGGLPPKLLNLLARNGCFTPTFIASGQNMNRTITDAVRFTENDAYKYKNLTFGLWAKWSEIDSFFILNSFDILSLLSSDDSRVLTKDDFDYVNFDPVGEPCTTQMVIKYLVAHGRKDRTYKYIDPKLRLHDIKTFDYHQQRNMEAMLSVSWREIFDHVIGSLFDRTTRLNPQLLNPYIMAGIQSSKSGYYSEASPKPMRMNHPKEIHHDICFYATGERLLTDIAPDPLSFDKSCLSRSSTNCVSDADWTMYNRISGFHPELNIQFEHIEGRIDCPPSSLVRKGKWRDRVFRVSNANDARDNNGYVYTIPNRMTIAQLRNDIQIIEVALTNSHNANFMTNKELITHDYFIVKYYKYRTIKEKEKDEDAVSSGKK